MSDNDTQAETVVLFRTAARALRNTAPDSPFAEAVANWLDTEAILTGELEPFVNLISATIKTKTGEAGYLQLGRREDGSIDMRAMSTPAAVRLAKVILGQEDDQ